MALYKGSSKLKDLYVGNTKIKEAYVGSTCVYRAAFDVYWLSIAWDRSYQENLTFEYMGVDDSRASLLSGRTSQNGTNWNSISNSDLLKVTGATAGGVNFYTYTVEFKFDLNYTPSKIVWKANSYYAPTGDIVATFYGVRNSQRIALKSITGYQNYGVTFTITL